MVSRIHRHKQETRERVLTAAYDLFARQGVAKTTLEQICQHADVANRTFFNHYPTRQAMLEALADHRLSNVHDLIDDPTQPVRARLVQLFDKLTVTLTGPGDAQPDVLGALSSAMVCRGPRRTRLYKMVIELVKGGADRGELTSRHEPQILADIIVGALTGVIAGSAMDTAEQLRKKMHDVGVALADLLTASGDSSACVPTAITTQTPLPESCRAVDI